MKTKMLEICCFLFIFVKDEESKIEKLRGDPLEIGTLEEFIDDNHAIISTNLGPNYHVTILSFVDKDLLDPGTSVLLHHKSHSIVGIMSDQADPLLNVMKVDKAPLESYADIGGLEE